MHNCERLSLANKRRLCVCVSAFGSHKYLKNNGKGLRFLSVFLGRLFDAPCQIKSKPVQGL